MDTSAKQENLLEMRWAQALDVSQSNLILDYVDTLLVSTNSEDARTWDLVVHFLIPESLADSDPLSRIKQDQFNFYTLNDEKTLISIRKYQVDSENQVIRMTIGELANSPLNYKLYQLRIENQPLLKEPLNYGIVNTAGIVTASDPETPVNEEDDTPGSIHIDYRARDYEALRQAMLDRLSTTMPQWRAQSPSDLGIMLVEMLAFHGDVLSYHQDAVTTEAYLGTARLRPSVRRHATLLDYQVNDGSNSRVWIQVEIGSSDTFQSSGPDDYFRIPKGTRFITRLKGVDEPLVSEYSFQIYRNDDTRVFESMHEAELFRNYNAMEIYTFESSNFVLARGSISLYLDKVSRPPTVNQVLLIKQTVSPSTGRPEDADPRLAHTVRLTEVELYKQTEENQPNPESLEAEEQPPASGIYKISWSPEEALPFDLTICKKGRPTANMSGNLVLCDHGELQKEESLPAVEWEETYRPVLPKANLTHQYSYDHEDLNNQPSCSVHPSSSSFAKPIVRLDEYTPNHHKLPVVWETRRNLLDSGPQDRHFVVELQDDLSARLLFGDGVNGWKPDEGHYFKATFRIGNGRQGNIGPNTIAHAILDEHLMPSVSEYPPIRSVLNPIPARGGRDPEPLTRIKLTAPTAFRVQQRCVTPEDYELRARTHPEVQSITARRMTRGPTAVVTLFVDRKGGYPIDEPFKQRLSQYLEPYRIMGDLLDIRKPFAAALQVSLEVRIEPGHFPNNVKAKILDRLGPNMQEDGTPGFFHPDSIDIGEDIYLSSITSDVMNVTGVSSVKPLIFRRLDNPIQDEIKSGTIEIGHYEMATVANDPYHPERGSLEITIVN